jgi:probable DNA metabolism protein
LRIPDNFLYNLSLHKDCSERLLAMAKSLTPQDLEISVDQEAMRLRKMIYAVMGEVHRMKAFVRLKPFGPQVLYGYLKPRHRIGEYITDHFARRTPGIIVVLGNGSESWISFFRNGRIMRDHGKGMAETLERLSSALDCPADGPNVENPGVDDIWRVYYDSQYCPEHRNLTAFRQRMPKKDQNAAGLRVIQNKKGISLDDFLGKS